VATAREKTLTSPKPIARPKLGDLALDRLADELSAGSISLVTSDVFDTIVFRPVGAPVAIFELIGEALVARGMLRPQITAAAFGRLRATAERRARVVRHAVYGDHEASLHEIYRQIEPILAEGIALGEAAALEVAVERDILVPNLDVVATLCYAADCGVPVVAVSDSYLSAGHIRELFAQPVLEDLVLADVFTSSDRRRNKGGGLLEEIVAELGVPAARLAHIGDHPEADLIVAQRMRARPVHLDRHQPDLTEVTEREQRFGERRVSGYAEQYDGGLAAVRAQLLRSHQLDAVSPALAPYWRWGATVLGPVLTGFAEWIHERLVELDSTRVWCFMREGAFISQMLAASVPQLEREIDEANAELEPLRSFVLPGGSRLDAELHICRTVCRRAERLLVALAKEQSVPPEGVRYLNRLSDALFVWSRWVNRMLGAPETLWEPNAAASGASHQTESGAADQS